MISVKRKLKFVNMECHVPLDVRRHYAELSQGWPEPKGSGHLAVVGGSPTVRDKLDVLRAWPGEIWAINGACNWLREHGIESTYFSADPADDRALITGAKKAVLAAHCHPEMFKVAAETYRFPSENLPGTTSAVASTVVAVAAGFREVTYFGCGSSYTTITHVYEAEETKDYLLVACNGEEFLTKPEFLVQAEQLSSAIRAHPDIYHEESGGLLRAMVIDPDYDALKGSRHLVESTQSE